MLWLVVYRVSFDVDHCFLHSCMLLCLFPLLHCVVIICEASRYGLSLSVACFSFLWQLGLDMHATTANFPFNIEVNSGLM